MSMDFRLVFNLGFTTYQMCDPEQVTLLDQSYISSFLTWRYSQAHSSKCTINYTHTKFLIIYYVNKYMRRLYIWTILAELLEELLSKIH